MNTKEKYDLAQKDTDEFRKTMLEEMGEDGVKKHEIVEEVLDKLAQNNISAFIYAELPNLLYPVGVPCIYQFNTMRALCKFNDDGTVSEESVKMIGEFNAMMWQAFFHTITCVGSVAKDAGLDKLDPKDPETFKARMDFFVNFMCDCLGKASEIYYKANDNQ